MHRLLYVVLALSFALFLVACEEEKPQEPVEPVEPVLPAVVYEMSELAATPVVFKELTGDYDLFGDAVEAGFTALKDAKIEVVSDPFGVFFDDPALVAPDELRSEVCFPVAADVKPPKGYAYKVTEPCKAVMTTFMGEFTDENMPDYAALYKYVADQGLLVAGPMLNVYHWGSEDPAEYVTDIYVPVTEPPAPEAETAETPATEPAEEPPA
ncbi:MAG TPA: GyrI-like domain-containing protein [bacterium]|nr:GyrI-like domain-containing protein [bacterium]